MINENAFLYITFHLLILCIELFLSLYIILFTMNLNEYVINSNIKYNNF